MSKHALHGILKNRKHAPAAWPAIAVMAAVASGPLVYGQPGSAASSAAGDQDLPVLPTHMSEALRASVDKVVIIGGESPAGNEVTGSYRKATPGLVGGMDEGSRIGTISKDIGGIPVHVPVPILSQAGMIFGGISGVTKHEIQELRDALTKDLANAADQPLTSLALASDVYFALQKLRNLESRVYAETTPVPEDTDAILYVNVISLTIDVDGKDAVLTTSAEATLRRLADGWDLFETEVSYQDRDALGNWTENDNALWRAYANFARHYLAREIAAEVFDRVRLNHELHPRESDTVDRVKRNDWQGITRSTTPTLAWELTLQGGNGYGAWAESIDESDVYYDVEIYDARSLVYAEPQVPDPSHTVLFELEPCKTYRWSVRPSYRVGNDVKYGEWMRFKINSASDGETGNGNIGRQASFAPAYTQDFAELEIKCGRK